MRGRYADWEECHHGDVFDFWARVELGLIDAGADFPRVLRSLAAFLGVAGSATMSGRSTLRDTPAPNFLADAKAKADTNSIAMMISQSTLAETSPAIAYLRARGIIGTIANAADLRFLPAIALEPKALGRLYAGTGATPPRWLNHPALLCLARNATGEVTGVQRILLSANGKARARTSVQKLSTGRLKGAALQLPELPSSKTSPIVLAEGPETALSLWTVTGYETRAVLGGFGGSYAFPRDQTLLVCHDADPADSPAATAREAFREALRENGHDVRYVAPPGNGPPGWDFNDVLQASELGAPAICDAVEAALRTPADHS